MAGSNLSLGIVVGSSLAGSFNSTFNSIGNKIGQTRKQLAGVRLGSTLADDVIKYRQKLDNLNTAQQQFGIGNTRLWGQIAETERHYRKAAQSAEKYGLNIGDIVRQHKILGDSALQAERKMDHLAKAELAKGKLSALKGQAIAAVGVAYSLAQPFKEAISFEHELRLFGNVVDFNNKQLGQTKTELVGVSKATNQSPGELLSALNTLASKGLDPSKSITSLSSIGKTATASGANVNDLATTAFTLIDAMGLSPEQLPKAMDMLAQAGKAGSFELRDMAQYFPVLTAQAKSLGMTGFDGIASLGSALQIAMKGASDPAQAAGNFKNFLSKLTAPDTVKKFSEIGVDIQASMKKSMAAGTDPVIDMINTIQKLTGGNKFKIGELFGDMEVISFLDPMLQNLDEFNRIKAESLAANGVVNKDFNAMMGTSEEKLKGVGGAVGRIGDAFASTLLPGLNAVLVPIEAVSTGLDWLVTNVPGVSWVVGGLSTGFVLYGAALGIATVAQWASNSAVVAGTNSLIGQAAAILWQKGVMLATVGATTAVTAAQWLWNAAMTANPIGLVIAGVVAFGALAVTVYKNWEPIMNWFGEKFAWLGKSMEWAKGLGGIIGGAVSSAGSAAGSSPTTGDTTSGSRGSLGDFARPAKNTAGAAALAAVLAAPSPAMAATSPHKAGAGTSPMVSQNNTFHITQLPGEDHNALTDRIMDQMARKQNADKRRNLYD